MVHNKVLQDIEKKQEHKKKLIHDFIYDKEKPVFYFVKEYDESFRRTFVDFKKFVYENYVRMFDRRYYFSERLHEKGIRRHPQTKTERFKDFNYPLFTKSALQKSFVKMTKKWVEFQKVEEELRKELYQFAYKNVEVNNIELTDFLKKWNMTDSSYFNARTQLIKKGLISVKRTIVQKQTPSNFDFNYKWEAPTTHKETITKYKAKSMLQEYLKYYFEGRIKTKETIEAFSTLRIPLTASIKEIKELLNNK